MLVLWGTIELNVGIFLTCLPSLTPLFTYFAQKSKLASYGLSYGQRRTAGANNSIPLPKYSQHSSHDSEPSAVHRSDSEENILPPKSDIMITKTTKVEVHEYDKESEIMGRRGW